MDIRFQFMKYRRMAAIASIAIFTISVLSLGFRGLSLGLDFSGGTLVEVSYETPVDLESIRNTLIVNGYDDSQVVNFGSNLDVLLRLLIKTEIALLAITFFKFLKPKALKESSKELSLLVLRLEQS